MSIFKNKRKSKNPTTKPTHIHMPPPSDKEKLKNDIDIYFLQGLYKLCHEFKYDESSIELVEKAINAYFLMFKMFEL